MVYLYSILSYSMSIIVNFVLVIAKKTSVVVHSTTGNLLQS